MQKKKVLNIRSLEVRELEKVVGGKDPIMDDYCPAIDVMTDSDDFQCGTGGDPQWPTCRYPYWVCL